MLLEKPDKRWGNWRLIQVVHHVVASLRGAQRLAQAQCVQSACTSAAHASCARRVRFVRGPRGGLNPQWRSSAARTADAAPPLCKENPHPMPRSVTAPLRAALAFLELLSLGFATIGAGPTLRAVVVQLVGNWPPVRSSEAA